MLKLLMPQALTVVVDIVAWGVFHAGTGYAAHRLGGARLSRDGWLLRPRPFEDDGRWYRRRLRIHRWKDKVPEAGALFAGGVSKKEVPAYDDESLLLFVRETRRAELTHWWAMACGPLFVLWNPPLAAALLVAYGVGINLPFIAIQRYNRFRIQAILRRRRR
ncbi:glycosyl-4,4'-diaponeurosporenoate acyltransferase [Nocardioides currus]|uniref:glycosyl-4,4'-diaponeurosporenoate acyltransferase CrtO family protein n=1 Tax=Nocardioides currus TaxID=2133958 RepID=UPI001402877D|nr:glycosyl-4,4'-diaponeurosporenoate acyltransferase [Nocardioides currus]